ncbi:MAG: rRNA maturation RNase YbeY [Gammaproteobacteria bacterium]
MTPRHAEARAPALALDLQQAVATRGVPDFAAVERAVAAALAGRRARAELTVRVVGRRESRVLNRRFRGIDKPTNVLSFPAQGLNAVAPDFLGDIVICAPLVAGEARERGKTLRAHWYHLVVHGVLHLLGYDHVDAADAHTMEDLEREIMAGLGFGDPYLA